MHEALTVRGIVNLLCFAASILSCVDLRLEHAVKSTTWMLAIVSNPMLCCVSRRMLSFELSVRKWRPFTLLCL